jgi:hypothetical protein
MLWTIVLVLLGVWLLGLLSRVGGVYIHVLLLLAAAAVMLNLITSRKG